jgi:hypothetical protein
MISFLLVSSKKPPHTFLPDQRGDVSWDTHHGGLMSVHIVLDHTDDTKHEFDPQNAEAVAEAEKRFKELTGLVSVTLYESLLTGVAIALAAAIFFAALVVKI